MFICFCVQVMKRGRSPSLDEASGVEMERVGYSLDSMVVEELLSQGIFSDVLGDGRYDQSDCVDFLDVDDMCLTCMSSSTDRWPRKRMRFTRKITSLKLNAIWNIVRVFLPLAHLSAVVLGYLPSKWIVDEEVATIAAFLPFVPQAPITPTYLGFALSTFIPVASACSIVINYLSPHALELPEGVERFAKPLSIIAGYLEHSIVPFTHASIDLGFFARSSRKLECLSKFDAPAIEEVGCLREGCDILFCGSYESSTEVPFHLCGPHSICRRMSRASFSMELRHVVNHQYSPVMSFIERSVPHPVWDDLRQYVMPNMNFIFMDLLDSAYFIDSDEAHLNGMCGPEAIIQYFVGYISTPGETEPADTDQSLVADLLNALTRLKEFAERTVFTTRTFIFNPSYLRGAFESLSEIFCKALRSVAGGAIEPADVPCHLVDDDVHYAFEPLDERIFSVIVEALRLLTLTDNWDTAINIVESLDAAIRKLYISGYDSEGPHSAEDDAEFSCEEFFYRGEDVDQPSQSRFFIRDMYDTLAEEWGALEIVHIDVNDGETEPGSSQEDEESPEARDLTDADRRRIASLLA